MTTPQPSPYPQPSQPPSQPQPLKSNQAVGALVCGLFSPLAWFASHGLALTLALVALVCAILALRSINRGVGSGRGMAVTGLVLGLFFSLAGLGSLNTTTPATTARKATVSTPAVNYYTAPTATAPTADTVAAVPPNTFTDGVYKVGSDIQPGTYKTDGTGGLGDTCVSSRLKNNDGSTGDIIDFNAQKGSQYLTVKPSDGYVKLSWGCTWSKVG